MSPKRFFAAALACAAIATAALLYARGSGDPLTAQRLEEARARWTEKGPEDYDLDVEVRGANEADYHIEVRGGEVAKMTTDGTPVPERIHEYWNVEGMFRFLKDELDNLERVGPAYGVADDTDVVVRADFDDTYGYPARFLRHVMGTPKSIEWEVTAFQLR